MNSKEQLKELIREIVKELVDEHHPDYPNAIVRAAILSKDKFHNWGKDGFCKNHGCTDHRADLATSSLCPALMKRMKTEVSASGGVSCPATKFFGGKVSDKTKRQGGMIPVSGAVNEGKKKQKSSKFINPEPKKVEPINEPIRRDDVDYINKEKKSALTRKDTKKVKSITKIQQLIKRSSPFYRIDEDAQPATTSTPETQTPDLNVGAETAKFEAGVESAEYKLKSQAIKSIKSKVLGKQVTAHSSKGYGQFKRDYVINVVDVKLEDYYGNNQVIFVGKDKKEYFIDTSYKVKISSAPAVAAPAETPQEEPATPEVAPETAPVQSEEPADLSKEIQK